MEARFPEKINADHKSIRLVSAKKLSSLSLPSESDYSEEPVIIRKPQGSEERKRTELVNTHLGIDHLSNLVNEYNTLFEGRLIQRIKEDEFHIKGALFLDNGNIVALLLSKASKLFNFSFYERNTGKLIKRKVLDDKVFKAVSIDEIKMTPNRNISVTFSNGRGGYYCNQQGEVLWHNKMERRNRELCILNDDSILFKVDDHIIRKNIDEEVKIDVPYSNFVSCGDFIPYGARGFILLSDSGIYLYDDNMKNKKLDIEYSDSITATKPINTNIILFGTEEGSLICYDTVKAKEIGRVTFEDEMKYIIRIEMLAHNRCLLICGSNSTSSDQNVKICNLGDLSEKPEANIQPDHMLEYMGTLSNSDVVIYHPVIDEDEDDLENNILIHNILENKTREVRLEWDDEWDNLEFCQVSSEDYLLAFDYIENIIVLWK